LPRLVAALGLCAALTERALAERLA